jgi:hydrogenase maturation factor/predicted fused transcriptional regulator/phosphomethylpyrimidine kinase
MIGKMNDDFFQKNILPHTGREDRDLIIGPGMGVDSAIIKISDGYMAIAEDPIFPSMSMTPEDFAFLTVHIGASDVAVMGIKPRFMTYSLLLPPETPENYIQTLIGSISQYAAELDISIAGGHTGFYGAVTVPTIGGITVWGNGPTYISPKNARENDNIIITKGAGIEAAALLAYELKETLLHHLPADTIYRSIARIREITVVKDAIIAAQNSGVHAMHDATEGGLVRGVWEIAQASEKRIQINEDDIFIPEDIQSICGYFHLNPCEIISEGTLILTCSPEKTAELLLSYRKAGIKAKVIGKVTSPGKGCVFIKNGKATPIVPPDKDQFWEVFFNSAALIIGNAPLSDEKSNTKLCKELQNTVDALCQANIHQLIPEVGANIAFAAPESETLENIAAVPGRIIRVREQCLPLGKVEMGSSTYMGSTLLTVRKHFPAVRCIMNLRSNEAILRACGQADFKTVKMPVPKDYRQSDKDFHHDLEKVLQTSQGLPDIIEIPDRLNLEKLILVLGTSLEELAMKVLQMNETVTK